jgi:hypothetical protein
MSVDHALFTTPGTNTWTCPDDVFGVIVECIGSGGTGSSGFGAGGGAYVMTWFDVVPGTDYEIFVASAGVTDPTYFISEETIKAACGEDATSTDPGFGGDKSDCVGTIVSRGSQGLAESAGGGKAFYNSTFSEIYGRGGAGGGFSGDDGAARISWRVGISGNGGGGGGGYARSVLDVNPGDEYDIQPGTQGLGQLGIPDDTEVTYEPLCHGSPSWFGSIDLVRAAGGDSAGTSHEESVSESSSDEDDSYNGLVDGALGGGKPGSNMENVGDVTFPGGNGGDGNGISMRFGFTGGGGGGVAGRRGPGDDAFDGKDGGGCGHSANNFNFRDFVTRRHGAGGNGYQLGENPGQDINQGLSPGGGGPGAPLDTRIGTGRSGYNHQARTVAAPGQVIIRGVKTGKLLIPGF